MQRYQFRNSKNPLRSALSFHSILTRPLFFCQILVLSAFLLGCQDKSSETQPPLESKQKTLASTEVANQISDFLLAKHITGKVQFQKSGQEIWKNLKVGQKIKPGYLIQTGAGARVVFEFPDASNVEILEKSLASIEDLAFQKKSRKSEIYLADGDLLFNVKKLATSNTKMKFTTPTATAAIRGTQGGVSTNGKSSVAFLQRGKLEVNEHGSNATSNISGLEYLYQTSQGFVTGQAKNEKSLSKSVSSKKSWMNTLKSPVIQKLYSPSKTQKYFQKELEKRLGKDISSLLNASTSGSSFKKEATRQLKNQASKQLKKSISPQLKKGEKRLTNEKKKAQKLLDDKKSKALNNLSNLKP